MKFTFAFILIALGMSFSSPADSFQLDGVPYPSSNVEIIWKASVTNLPTGLWIYKPIPRDFSMAVISNAMAIGSFKMLDIVNPRDTNSIQFRDKKDIWEARRRLTINPAQGAIEYNSIMPTAENRKIPTGVPTEEEGVKLAWDYLFRLGIDRSQAMQPHARVDIEIMSTNHVEWEGPYQCTVGVSRCIDGVRAYGGNFRIVFRRHAEVESIDLSWPDLVPYECHPVANVTEIINYIKNGQAVLPVPEFHFDRLADLKKLTITKITPYYFFEPATDGLFHPFAELEATADLGKKNYRGEEKLDLILRCPILSTNAFTIGKPID
jgi:hypothetical protein